MKSKYIYAAVVTALLATGIFGYHYLTPPASDYTLLTVRSDGDVRSLTEQEYITSLENKVKELQTRLESVEQQNNAHVQDLTRKINALKEQSRIYRTILPPTELPSLIQVLSADSKHKGPHRKQVLIAAYIAETWFKVPKRLITAMAWHESRYNGQAVSRSACKGTMQVSNLIWRTYSNGLHPRYVHDPLVGTLVGAHYISKLIRSHRGNTSRALAFYNAGGNYTAGLGYASVVLQTSRGHN